MPSTWSQGVCRRAGWLVVLPNQVLEFRVGRKSRSEQSCAEHRQAFARRSPIARKAERRGALCVDQGGGVAPSILTGYVKKTDLLCT
jgi:hypothetical protein